MKDEPRQGAVSKDEEQVVSDETPGLLLAMNAHAFLRGAETLHGSDPNAGSWTACFTNIGFAVELALKAYIREKGGSEKLQRRLGHDLVAAYDEAVQRGFTPFDDRQVKLIQDISPTFSDMTVRYGTCGWVQLPTIEVALQVARGLVEDVWGQCCLVPRNSHTAAISGAGRTDAPI